MFKFELPTPIIRRQIEQFIARKIGVPLDTIDKEAVALIRICTYLDHILIEKPDWWTSAEECHDEELLFNIYSAFIEFETEFREALKRGKFKDNSSG